MKKYIDIKYDKDYLELKSAALCIKKGGLVLFPTETVYGIGASGLNENAVKKIYEAKGRKTDNPLILHISNMDMLDVIATDITDIEYKLMDAFWPGPFTIILKKKDIVPNIVTGGLDTVAVRMPSNKIANKLIEYSAVPIAAPSANISGKPSGTCIDDVYEELKDKMDIIIDGGRCEVGLESTVVKVDGEDVKILRPGKITKEQIEKITNNVLLDEHIFSEVKEGEKILSPGMKYKHYAPESKCVLIYSDSNKKMVDEIISRMKDYKNSVVICSKENAKDYTNGTILTYGSKYNLEEISSNIFTILRKVDKLKPDIVFIEGVTQECLGLAIMNRLIRACSHEYIEV